MRSSMYRNISSKVRVSRPYPQTLTSHRLQKLSIHRKDLIKFSQIRSCCGGIPGVNRHNHDTIPGKPNSDLEHGQTHNIKSESHSHSAVINSDLHLHSHSEHSHSSNSDSSSSSNSSTNSNSNSNYTNSSKTGPLLTFLGLSSLTLAAAYATTASSIVYCEQSSSRLIDAGDASSWANGERREVDVSAITGIKNDSILVHKLDNEYYCTSSKSSHFDIPLKFGFDNKNSLQATCPAYDCSYSLKTGEAIRGPVLKGIDTFPVEVNKNGKVVVRLYPQSEKVQKQPVKRDPQNEETIVIVGSGAAGYACAETLRLEGFTGEIVMLSKESGAPINRTMLSKSPQKAPEMRSLDYLKKDLGVVLFDEMEVTEVNSETKTVSYRGYNKNNIKHKVQAPSSIQESRLVNSTKSTTDSSVSEIKFDKCLIATGGRPRKLFVPGAKLKNVFTLRTQDDNEQICNAVEKNHRVIVVGGGFIGLEIATMLSQKKGCKVTILEMTDLPLERVLGKKIGSCIAKWLHKNQVIFMGGVAVTYLRGEHYVNGIETDSGDVLPADAVIVATGVQMDTPMLSPLHSTTKAKDGSLLCDPFLKIRGNNDGSLFCAGDLATFPDYRSGRDLRLEHWNIAIEQGRTVALNMLGKFKPYTTVPYYWTEIFGKKLKMVGSIDTLQHSVTEGDCDEMKFVTWFVNPKDEITGVLTLENPKVACAASELLRLGKMPKASEVVVGACNSDDLIKRMEILSRGEELKKSIFERGLEFGPKK